MLALSFSLYYKNYVSPYLSILFINNNDHFAFSGIYLNKYIVLLNQIFIYV